ncbi:hypothetical protein P171DRAFT_439041 [Karstenula rhodostoma CBS 690.94]|uniref:Uncharacterized protein n=1 Tax=Karstenula rhodostoma CBS 690.94 TaxID=1392251 RepID=A0A9P4UH86_9PLEO|nr:hypothetical protein P171DRAFT_439041 [Karstenula rhodostoma CBS 690.94]
MSSNRSCECTYRMQFQHAVSTDPPGSIPSLYSPSEISKATAPTNKPETSRQTPGDGVLIEASSIVNKPRHEHAPPKEALDAAKTSYQPSVGTIHNRATDGSQLAMPELGEWVVEEITSDDDFESATWSDAETDIDGKAHASSATLIAPLKMSQVKVKPGIEGKASAPDAALIASPTTPQVAAKNDVNGKAPTSEPSLIVSSKTLQGVAMEDIDGKPHATNAATVAAPKTRKVTVKQDKLISSSKVSNIGVAPGKSPDFNTATNASSKTSEVEVKRYNIFSDSELRHTFEEAMRKTFPTNIFNAMLADLKGDAALDDGTSEEKTIRRVLDGIDESHRNIGLSTLAELYPKWLSKPKAEAEVKVKTLKERFADLTVKREPAELDQRGEKNTPAKDTAKDLVQAGILLKSSVDRGTTPKKPFQDVKLRYLELSPKARVPVSKDDKENADPKAKLEREKNPW